MQCWVTIQLMHFLSLKAGQKGGVAAVLLELPFFFAISFAFSRLPQFNFTVLL